ncbi:MAG: hypothetical protein GY821_03740 [Gammaproteobacteria bacterium]|nr:hypothetical protein [Gammaproteobacteria bacterium]
MISPAVSISVAHHFSQHKGLTGAILWTAQVLSAAIGVGIFGSIFKYALKHHLYINFRQLHVQISTAQQKIIETKLLDPKQLAAYFHHTDKLSVLSGVGRLTNMFMYSYTTVVVILLLLNIILGGYVVFLMSRAISKES